MGVKDVTLKANTPKTELYSLSYSNIQLYSLYINAVERTHDLFVQKLIKYKKLPMPSNPLRFDNVLKYLICNVLSF